MSNPLQKHFRKPGISITLPSNYYYYDDTVLDLNVNGELEIYPMTASDEMVLKNPDALLSGSALEQIVSSCVPAIKDVQSILANDLDAILLAIKATSYGNEYAITATCSECSHEDDYAIPIQNVLVSMDKMSPPYTVDINGALVEVKPYSFKDSNEAAMTSFEESQKLSHVTDDMDKKERSRLINESFEIVENLKMNLLTNNILRVTIKNDVDNSDIEVIDKDHIFEFLDNLPSKELDMIDDLISKINVIGIHKEQTIKCSNCGHEWKTEMEFNPSSFFA